MKRLLLAFVATLIMLPLSAQQLVQDSYRRLRVSYDVPEVIFDATELCGEKLIYPVVEGYLLGGDYGTPAVPYLSTLVAIPLCDTFSISIENAVYDTIDLPFDLDILPAQPPRSKSDTTAPSLVRSREAYNRDSYQGLPLAALHIAGIARDRRLAHICFAPLTINPVNRRAVVCRKAEISITYHQVDSAATIELYRRYHTPAFNSGETLNSLGLSSKGDAVSPTRLVIATPTSLNSRRLQTFADWKRRQGMMVDILTTDRTGSGARNELAASIKAMYTNASTDSPAPTYIIIVGDHEQIAAFDSQVSYSSMANHVTDLYYATFTDGDNLPDAYYGRFSATDTATLAQIITKTILYESYSFEDDSYLGRAALISGVDQGRTNDNAYKYSDPSMDYAAHLYVNAANGYSDVTYYKNRTSYAPAGVTVTGSSRPDSVARLLRELYDTGIGWVNYSAHGDWDSWYQPSFTATHAAAMKNTGKPSFMIGNCCLSGKFNRSRCLGEALLRRGDNAGAVVYLGASQETYWTHDFYWAVGVRSSVSGTSVPTYNSANLGFYDCLFHTHNEPTSKYAPTAGSIVYAGNLAVESTGSDQSSRLYAKYYWEIYHVFGDPSLMPWLGTAREMPFAIDTSDIASNNCIRITTVPGAYVALVDSATLRILAVTYADALGFATITAPSDVVLNHSFFSATAQGYRPYISNFNHVDLGLDIAIHAYPNPTSDKITILGSNIHSITLATIGGSIIAVLPVESDYYTIDLSNFQPGFYLALITTDDGTTLQRIIKN